MIEKSTYITQNEEEILKDDISSQVLKLKENLNDKSKFHIKKSKDVISVMREGDIDGDESV